MEDKRMKKTLISMIAALLIACMAVPAMAEPTLTIIDPAAVSAEPAATPEPQPVEVPAVVILPYKDGSINVREINNTDSAIVTSLKHEDAITVILYGGVWSRIRTESGKEGYIKNLYINDGNPVYAAGNVYFDAARTVTIIADIAMYAGASVETEMVSTALAGAEFTALAENGAFTLVASPDGALSYVESAGLK